MAFSLLLHAFLFAVVGCWGFPIYGSADDTFLAYLLQGGFGSAPTELLHYSGAFHPFLGVFVKNTALLIPGLNAYSLWLYAGFFAAFSALFGLLLRRQFSPRSVLFYLFFFAVFGVPLLLRPTFTNLALILSMAAFAHLYDLRNDTRLSLHRLFLSWLFFTCSVMLRLPAFLLVILPAFMLFFPRTHVQRVRLFFCITLFAVTSAVLPISQRAYYSAKIPDWSLQNSYRNTFFSLVNRSLVKPSEGPLSCIYFCASNGIFWEKSTLSESHLSLMDKPIGYKASARFLDEEFWKWLVINNKSFLLFSFVIFLLIWFCRKRRFFYLGLFAFLLMQVFVLAVFFKLPPYVLPFMLCFFSFFCLYDLSPEENRVLWFIPVFALIAAYAVFKSYQADLSARARNGLLKNKTDELIRHPQDVFVATDDFFPLEDFHAFDSPASFPLGNLLNKDRLITDRFSFSLQKTLTENPEKRIYFLGNMSPEFVRCAMPSGYRAVRDSAFRSNSVFAIRP